MSAGYQTAAMRVVTVLGVLLLIGAVAFYSAVDLVLTVVPSVVAVLVTIAYCLVVLLVAMSLLWSFPGRLRIAAALLTCLAIFAIRLTDTNSRKPFLRSLSQVQTGMTVAEVDRIMAGFQRSPAGPGELAPAGTVGFRHTDEGWGNADIGLVTFHGGHVVEVRFLPD